MPTPCAAAPPASSDRFDFHNHRRLRMIQRRAVTMTLGAALIGLSGFADAQQSPEVYIPLVSKGFQHQFWQAVKSGAEHAAKDLKVKISFEGPEAEPMVDKQIDMLAAALAEK